MYLLGGLFIYSGHLSYWPFSFLQQDLMSWMLSLKQVFCLLYMCTREFYKNCSLETKSSESGSVRAKRCSQSNIIKRKSKSSSSLKQFPEKCEQPMQHQVQGLSASKWEQPTLARVRENVPRRLVGGADCWLLTVWDFDIFAAYWSWGMRSQTSLRCVQGRVDS